MLGTASRYIPAGHHLPPGPLTKYFPFCQPALQPPSPLYQQPNSSFAVSQADAGFQVQAVTWCLSEVLAVAAAVRGADVVTCAITEAVTAKIDHPAQYNSPSQPNVPFQCRCRCTCRRWCRGGGRPGVWVDFRPPKRRDSPGTGFNQSGSNLRSAISGSLALSAVSRAISITPVVPRYRRLAVATEQFRSVGS